MLTGMKYKMIPFKKCPICGGEVIEKKVEKLLRGGKNTAVVIVQAEVCLHCGERLYSKDMVSYFERMHTAFNYCYKLENEECGRHRSNAGR